MSKQALYTNERNNTIGLEALLKNQRWEIDASKEDVGKLKDALVSALTNDGRDGAPAAQPFVMLHDSANKTLT